jgi:hypothetical protein
MNTLEKLYMYIYIYIYIYLETTRNSLINDRGRIKEKSTLDTIIPKRTTCVTSPSSQNLTVCKANQFKDISCGKSTR